MEKSNGPKYIYFAKLLILGFSILGVWCFTPGIEIQAGENITSIPKIWLHRAVRQISPEVQAEFRLPQAIDTDEAGNFYITDAYYHRIIRLNSDLRVTARTSGWGSHSDLLDTPVDLSCNRGLDLFVADYRNGRVVRFDRDLNFLSDLKLSDIDRRFEFPLTLALSKWGELYVLEETSSIVIKIETASNLSTFFGGYKPGAENLNGAKKAALDEEGNLYFALPQVDCISVFDRYGNFMGQRPLGFKVIAIESDGKFLWCSDGKEIKCLYDHQFLDIAFADERNRLQANIIDIAAGNGNLILLSSDAPYIHIYQLSTSPSSIVW